MSSGAGGGLPRRRNGKQQACEPCRKAKIACDHSLPICDRCKRRKVSARCVYVEAPMTRNPTEDRHRRRTSSSIIHHIPLTPNTGSSVSPKVSISTPNPKPKAGPFIKSGGFFGPTSFSAVFLENRENLGNDDDIQISNDAGPHPAPDESLQSQTFLMLASNEYRGPPRVALGVKVLKAFPDHHTCKFLLEWYFANTHECTFHKPSLMAVASSIWSTFGKHLKEPRRVSDLEQASEMLCRNAETALPDFEDYDNWLASFTGENLRWEVVGIVFGALTSATLSLPERDAFFCTQRGQRTNRKSFALELKDCVQSCVTLSNYMDLINMQMVALLARNLVLQTVLSGDTSLMVWRQLGDLVSASTAMGLHREVDADAAGPISFVSELRRRIFAVVFNFDKGSSVLTGRPPALSYRYCRFRLPLDVSDEVIMRGGEELSRAVEKLDRDGWNTDGKIYPNTTIRARCTLAIILNEILEISLGEFGDDRNEKIKYLMNKLEKTYASFPSFMHWNSDLITSSGIPDLTIFQLLGLRLHMLEHRLLLERLAYKQGLLDGQSMVNCAREMLELTVLVWVQRDRFVEHHHDYDWMLMCWGVPSSGVLCVELLKQMKAPPGRVHVPCVPRAEVVQNLSLLIGFLEWVRPAAGNYKLCGRMRLVIKRILTRILNPATQLESVPSSQESAQTTTTGAGPMPQMFEPASTMTPFDSTMFAGAFDDSLENLDWLNEIDWSRGPWIDLGGTAGQDFAAARWG